MKRRTTYAAVAGLVLVAGCKPADPNHGRVDVPGIERAAHHTYVSAINSNDPDRLIADLTDDVVYQAPGAPEIVGKAAVGAWIKSYLAAYHTKWEKTSIGFTVAGRWAFERYTYTSTNTDRKTGAVTTDVGKGVNVFHLEEDSKWRVAIDSWSSDKPRPN
jgi:ketosteroid isomerase-like protein